MLPSFKHFFTEKTILGIEEDIYLDGVGVVKAKLDTGNGAYNVLHGENIEVNGGEVMFTTMNGKKINKPMEETIVINVGAGNKEDRPVVLFNVKIGNSSFPNIPFSIGNRADNMHKVLIGKDFIGGNLDALIDVTLTNVATKNLEVSI